MKMSLYLVKYGLGGGFGGAKESEVLDCENVEEATDAAHEMAIEFASHYEGMYGLPDYHQILEEEDCSEDEANEIYYEQLEAWLDYGVEEYHE